MFPVQKFCKIQLPAILFAKFCTYNTLERNKWIKTFVFRLTMRLKQKCTRTDNNCYKLYTTFILPLFTTHNHYYHKWYSITINYYKYSTIFCILLNSYISWAKVEKRVLYDTIRYTCLEWHVCYLDPGTPGQWGDCWKIWISTRNWNKY